MSEAIVGALITAITTIIATIIQTRSVQSQAVLSPPNAQLLLNPVVPEYDVPAARDLRKTSDIKTWLWLTVILAAGFVIAPEILKAVMDNNTLIAGIVILLIPIVTIFLAIARPLPWGWAATFVAILHGANLFGYAMQGGDFVKGDGQFLLTIYIVNAFVVALISFLRRRRIRKKALSYAH